MATLLPRRIVGILTSLLVVTAAVAGLAGPAHAEDGYQYWNYFHLENDTWAFSQVGTADYRPEDGDVEGFRYGTSTESTGIEPRADLGEVNFETICADTEAAAGEKRVALVLDFGVDEGNGPPPEPRAECAVVAQDATTQQVLGEVAEVRVEGGMTCALDGYPATGCGEPVKNAQVEADEQPIAFAMPSSEGDDAGTSDAAADSQESGVPWGLVAAALIVVLIAAGAFTLSRRNKSA
ncbi:MAG TPA: SCO2322 family protein [Nocardioidaceae bacterium]|nr:SCO2322 family protein [Nocardioidaceae bacterium]